LFARRVCSLIVLKSRIVTDLMGTFGILFGRPLRAHPNSLSYPGLKPWAILLCHFVAFAHTPIR
jgi:hypothetical protein